MGTMLFGDPREGNVRLVPCWFHLIAIIPMVSASVHVSDHCQCYWQLCLLTVPKVDPITQHDNVD